MYNMDVEQTSFKVLAVNMYGSLNRIDYLDEIAMASGYLNF